jgi:signal transduction histidine kinase
MGGDRSKNIWIRRTEKEPTTAHYALEQKSAECTVELAQTKEQLKRETDKRKRAEEELLFYQKQLHALASELSMIEERERQRLATNLHDSVAQILAISRMKLDVLRGAVPSAAFAKQLSEMYELIGEALCQTKSLIFELSPPALNEQGFEIALRSLAERMQKYYRFCIEFQIVKQPKPMSGDLQVFLFRALQELLVNIVKHAQAQNVRITIGGDGCHAQIVVEDDGIGFDTSEPATYVNEPKGFGLFSIRKCLRNIGGHFQIDSKPGNGTRVTLLAPLECEAGSTKEKVI